MRILFADSNHPVLHETLLSAGFTCDLHWEKSAEELAASLPLYDGLVIRSRFKIDAALIDRCPRLKCIGRVGAGMENIDVAYAAAKGIACLCVPEGNRDAVGEHALGMLLMLMNNLKKADGEVRRGLWLRAENRGYEIKDKVVGIIGYGNMGSAFAEKLSGFGCKILAYDKYKKDFGNGLVKETDMQELYAGCDIVSLHLPLSPETRHMASREFFAAFKKPIYFINTARGQCLDTPALVESLVSGGVRGACLDVLEYERSSFEGLDQEHLPAALKYLISSEKVVLSPHIAGWTHESNYRMSRLIAVKMIETLKAISPADGVGG